MPSEEEGREHSLVKRKRKHDDAVDKLPVINVKRDIRDIKVIKPARLTLEDIEKESDDEAIVSEEPSTASGTKPIKEDAEERERRTGVVHLQTVPPNFTAEKTRDKKGKRRKRYVEGWVEFKRKKVAKQIAKMLNGQLVGGKRRSAAHDTLWAIKYLSGFKWVHLMEQLDYERRVEEQRLRVELTQAKKEAEHFAEQVAKGARIKRLEEKMLKKSGLWDRYQKQVRQRQLIDESKKEKSKAVNESDDFLHMIFDKE
ncbi:basal transcriptional activator hABT1 [Aphelenchoides avenae]|nr:basal transcriptional activator hABT1 [Aphelenchus avenae]